MLSEIYCRQKDDIKADGLLLEHSDVYETVLGKIRMILMTEKGTILGEPNFGASLESYIFDTNFPASEVEKEIKTQIALYVKEANLFDIKVKVSLQKGEYSDIGYVDVTINGTQELGVIVK